MKKIALTRGKVALVDDEDYDVLSAVKWYSRQHRRTFYALRSTRIFDGNRVNEWMHRVVLARKLGRPIVPGMHTDHINGNGLDNRRENLREVTRSQNQHNLHHLVANRSSQYLGVYWYRERRMWRATIHIKGKTIHLGNHVTELAAAQARESFIFTRPNLYARSNFGAAS